jgi:ATP-dependent RNA helicase DDX19/DBP5
MFLIVKSLLVTGAVFNLLCGGTDNVVMRKIEGCFQHKVPEVM